MGQQDEAAVKSGRADVDARKPLERVQKRERKWSGLSESNRHLNLGKVPYYHYTKAASDYNFYNTLAPATTRHSRTS